MKTFFISKDQKSKKFFAPLLLVLVGLIVYSNSLRGPFVFDDTNQIMSNPRILRLWPLTDVLSHTNRPVVDLTIAINYQLGGFEPFGYHVLNLLIHLANALVLYLLLLRTLARNPTPRHLRENAFILALSITLLWTVHPLLTQAVTYTIQRAESLMALFFLLTLYSLVRSDDEINNPAWPILAIMFCALGMGCKEVMVACPVVALFYDRIFLSSSFQEVWKKRRWMYFGFLLTWVLLFFLATTPRTNDLVAGKIAGLTPYKYGLTQFKVITHYIRLIFWPHPLILDYFSWPLAQSWVEVWPYLLYILGLVILTVVGFIFQPFLAFWGLWFFVILGPTSSVFPIGDLIFEHRMYLPSIAGIVLFVTIGYSLLLKLPGQMKRKRQIGSYVVAGLIIILGGLTIFRNQEYQNEITLWRSVLEHWPQNDRAEIMLGNVAYRKGDMIEAEDHYKKAITLNSDYDKPYYSLATVYFRLKNKELLRINLEKALSINPKFSEASYLIGMSYLEDKDATTARAYFDMAVQANPQFTKAHYQLAVMDFSEGKQKEAAVHFQLMLKQEPNNVLARYNLATIFANKGNYKEAQKLFTEVVRQDPTFEDAQQRLKILNGRLQEDNK